MSNVIPLQPVILESRVMGQNTNEEVIFRRLAEPGELVAVNIGNQTIHVHARTLVLAIRLMELKGESLA